MSRRAWDAYYTPRPITRAMLRRVVLSGVVLEPCVGGGDIADLLHADPALTVITNDANPQVEADYHLDAADPATWKRFPPVDWVATNPPFNEANRIVPLAHAHATRGIVMLLPITWGEPCDVRAHFLTNHPWAWQYNCPRMSFTGDGGTSPITVAWYVWDKAAHPRIFAIPKDELEEVKQQPLFRS